MDGAVVMRLRRRLRHGSGESTCVSSFSSAGVDGRVRPGHDGVGYGGLPAMTVGGCGMTTLRPIRPYR